MTNLSEHELLEWLEDGLATYKKIKKYQGKLDDKEIDKGIQAYQQIVALIKKPEITEEWIEEKAKELHDKAYDAYPSIRSAVYWKDFIRSLIDSIEGGK